MKDTVYEELMKLERNGKITARAVVDTARDPANPLHACFEWNDSVAADKHRLDQARTLIRSVRVVITNDVETIAVPRYVRDPSVDAQQQGYVAVQSIAGSIDAKDAVLYEVRRALAALQRADEIAAALDVRPLIGEAWRLMQDLKARVEEHFNV